MGENLDKKNNLNEDYKIQYFEKEVLKTLVIDGMTVEFAGDGLAEVSLKITDQMLNVYGKIHGGVLFTVADYASGASASAMGKSVVTLNANINYIKATASKNIIAKSNVVHGGKSTVIADVDVIDSDDGTLLCTSTFTMFVIGKYKDIIGKV